MRYFVWVYSDIAVSLIDKAVKEVAYLEEELDWKVYIIFINTEFA